MKIGPYTLNQVYEGDCRELSLQIPDQSINLIFTDPIYQNIKDYSWLAGLAARVLRPDGHLLVYVTQQHLPLQLKALSIDGLHWGWQFSVQLFGRRAAIFYKKVQACGQQIVWFSKSENFDHPEWVHDFIGVQTRRPHGHRWRKGTTETLQYLAGFTNPGDVVLDPFCGGGTIPAMCERAGRRWLAYDRDPEAILETQQWIGEEREWGKLFGDQVEQVRQLVIKDFPDR